MPKLANLGTRSDGCHCGAGWAVGGRGKREAGRHSGTRCGPRLPCSGEPQQQESCITIDSRVTVTSDECGAYICLSQGTAQNCLSLSIYPSVCLSFCPFVYLCPSVRGIGWSGLPRVVTMLDTQCSWGQQNSSFICYQGESK